jgi:DNA-binding response OmpR family regulator
MAVLPQEILIVGTTSASTDRLVFRLTPRGHRVRHVDTLAEAKSLLKANHFRFTLASERLPDGRGYDLARAVAQNAGYLFVGVPLTETLWLPVIELGAVVFGQRALKANVFENEVEMALRALRSESIAVDHPGPSASGGVSDPNASPKRKSARAA